MKYRRKGEIVDATYYSSYVWHGRGAYVNETWVEGSYLVVDDMGRLHIYDKHRFEREFEPCEKEHPFRGVTEYTVPDPDLKPAPGYVDLHAAASVHFKPDYGFRQNYVCAACGKGIGKSEAFVVSSGHGEALCRDCYNRWARCPEKNQTKPLTIADLKPGDVFEFDYIETEGVRTCQHMGTNSSNSPCWAIFYADMGGGIPGLRARNKERPGFRLIHCLGHHDLTEKQRLWAGAEEKTREALEKGISEKWLPILRNERRGSGSADCPLCQRFGSSAEGCRGRNGDCLFHRGSFKGCCYAGHAMPLENPRDQIIYSQARDFTLWQAGFLPNIHPLRIEVEAIPKEWPGKARDK